MRLQRLRNGARPETRAVVEAEVSAAEIEVVHAERTWRRTQQLVASQATSLQSADNDRHRFQSASAHLQLVRAKYAELVAPPRAEDVAAAEADVEAARARRQQAAARLEQRILKAPVDGRVVDVHFELGAMLTATQPLPVVTMADDRRLRIRAFVEEHDVLRVTAGQPAWITHDGHRQQPLQGVVASCSPYLKPKPRLRAKPGMPTDVKVREVLIDLPPEAASQLILGLPVDVRIAPAKRRPDP